MTIEEFIAARLDEDEAIARSAATSEDVYDGTGSRDNPDWLVLDFDEEGITVWDKNQHKADGSSGHESDLTRHMSRHDPARVLRTVAALRSAVEDLALIPELQSNLEGEFGSPGEAAKVEAAGPDLRPIASIWSDHPDYKTDWVVEA